VRSSVLNVEPPNWLKELIDMRTSQIAVLLLVMMVASILAPVKLANAQTADFEVSASPPRVSVGSDGTAHYVVTITSINGFTGTVQLSVTGITNVGLQAAYFAFSPTLVQVAANGQAFSALTLTTNYQYTTTGFGITTINFVVTASASGITHTAPLAADLFYGLSSTVQLTSLAVNLQPDTLLVSGDITKSENATLQLTLTSQATTQLGVLLFTGALQAYDIPTGLYISFNPTAVNIFGGQTAQVTVSVLMTPQFLQNGGTYKFAIGVNALMQGTLFTSYNSYGNYFLSKVGVLTIVIPPSFNIAINPSVLNVPIGGGDQQFAISVTPLTKGLTEPIVLSVQGVPAGIITNFQSSTLIANGIQPLSTNLVLNAPSGTWPTTATIRITAQAAGASSYADASLNIEPQGDYSVQADQTTIAFTGVGQSRSVTLTITPQGGFKSSISFSTTNLPSGMTATFSTANVTVQQSAPLNVILTLTAGQNLQPGTYDVSVMSNTGFSQKNLVLTVLVRAGGAEIWPVVLVMVVAIAVVSLIIFVGMPRGRDVRRIPERESDRPRLPP
jgi:hypothetical protein